MASMELLKTILMNSTNLKAYYRFESGALTTDSSGNGYTLTNNNSVAEGTGKFGSGADFGTSNTNKSFSRTDALGTSQNEDKSISLWIKANSELSGGDVYENLAYLIYDANDINFFIDRRRVSGVNQVCVGIGRVNIVAYETTYNTSLGTTSWHHIAFSYTQSTGIIRGYFDGAYFGSATRGAGDGTGVSSDGFGINVGTADCVIDDVNVFSLALSADQIKELYEGRNLGELRPQTGLVALYHLGSETDFSGNNYHLTNNNGVAFNTGKFGKGADFGASNTNKSLNVSSLLGLTYNGSFTVNLWLSSPNTTSANDHPAFFGWYDDTNKVGYYLHLGASGLGCARLKTNISWTETKAISITANTWTMVTMTYDGTNLTLYKNGALVGSVVATGTGSTASYFQGSYLMTNYDGSKFLSGLVDEVAIFNVAKSASWIRQQYSLIRFGE